MLAALACQVVDKHVPKPPPFDPGAGLARADEGSESSVDRCRGCRLGDRAPPTKERTRTVEADPRDEIDR